MNTVSRFDTVLSALFIPKANTKPSSSPTKAKTDAAWRPNDQDKLSRLPSVPRPRYGKSKRRAKPTTSSIKLPPPSTPLLVRIVLAFWSILLSFWTSLVGETRASRVSRTKRIKDHGRGLLRTLKEGAGIGGGGVSSDEGEASGSDIEVDEDALDINPVTQNNDTSPVDQPDDMEFLSVAPKPHRESFSFRLRSAENNALRETIPPPSHSTRTYTRAQNPPSILSNPIKKTNRLLPNPMATSVLDPSVPVASTSSSVPHPNPPRPHQTPFHHQKTLILDLDETLIHSTSRPMSYAGSAGGGLMGLSFGGLLGGRRSRREGHTVEVVLNGRSTTYHVYKRPYVDHFLKKVSSRLSAAEVISCSGRIVVYPCHIHRVHARIR